MGFDPVAYINEPRWQKVSLGLERMRLMLELLGNPERSLRFVHVAGTNGKGSTCAYLDAICRTAGLKTGLFTSPYIHRFEERIRVNGDDISSADLLSCTVAVKEAADAVEAQTGEHPTEFELMCAVALTHFARSACDICIMEVGLGGRLDATNVITPDVSVITPISFDHTAFLGSTIADIAHEKAGIIKPGIPCLSAPQQAEALKVIEQTCEERGCAFESLDVADITDAHLTDSLMRMFRYQGEPFEMQLIGSYQPMNASLAIECARMLRSLGWPFAEDAIHEGIARAAWPGRFQALSTSPLIVIDGAHNADGSAALKASLDELRSLTDRDITFVVGVLADKDVAAILEPHLSAGRAFFTYAPDNPRALSAEELARIICERQPQAEIHVCTSAADAMRRAQEKAPEGIIVAFGSLYSIAALEAAAS